MILICRCKLSDVQYHSDEIIREQILRIYETMEDTPVHEYITITYPQN